MKNIKFIIFSQEIPSGMPGGASTTCRVWHDLLNHFGDIIGIYSTSEAVSDEFRVPTHKDQNYMYTTEKIVKKILRMKPNLLVFLHCWGFNYYTLKILQNIGIPTLFRFGDQWPLYSRANRKGMSKIVTTCAIYNSVLLKKTLQNHIIAKKEFILRNCVKIGKRTKFPFSRDLVFTYIGRIEEKKGVYLIPFVGKYLKDKGIKNIKLKIYGTSRKKKNLYKLYALINTLGVKDIVFYGGGVETRMIDEIFKETHALLFPSLRRFRQTIEGCPNVILEAWANSRGIIGNFFDGAAEIISHKVDSIAINSTNPEEWGELLITFSHNLIFLKKLGYHGYFKVKNNFSYRKCLQKLNKVFQALSVI